MLEPIFLGSAVQPLGDTCGEAFFVNPMPFHWLDGALVVVRPVLVLAHVDTPEIEEIGVAFVAQKQSFAAIADKDPIAVLYLHVCHGAPPKPRPESFGAPSGSVLSRLQTARTCRIGLPGAIACTALAMACASMPKW